MSLPARHSRRPGRRRTAAWVAAAMVAAGAAGALAAGMASGGRPDRRPAAQGLAAPGGSGRVEAAAAAQAAAQAAAGTASAAAADAQSRLQAVQQAAARIAALSTTSLARNPAAQDPTTALGPLQQAEDALAADVQQAGQAASAASAEARAATAAARGEASAANFAAEAGAAAAAAATAARQATQAEGQAEALANTALAGIQAWVQVHTAPPGYLGVEVTDPPASWTAQGCEVVTTLPGGPAERIGLVGREQRTDPVGDVVTAITDATDGGVQWETPNCAAFQAAMAQTRAGDQVTLAFDHRQVIWYLLSGRWVPETATTTLTAGPASDCPAPLSGTISPAATGSRINLTVTLGGPSGSSGPMRLMLDTGGEQTYLPDALLRGLGYRPFWSEPFGGVVPGAWATANLYRVPGSALTVEDGGQAVPLATGTLTIAGLPPGAPAGLGPDILKQGSRLTTAGSRWTLTPPCAG